MPLALSSGALSISPSGAGLALVREDLRDGRGQRRLAVVDVADRADVHVGLGAVVGAEAAQALPG